MSKFRGRKLKGGQPQMNTPLVSQGNPPSQPKPPTPSTPSAPPKIPPNPVKTPPPGVGAAAKTLEKAEEGISFFEQYGYQLAIGFIVVLIIAIVVYYLFIRDIPGQGGDSSAASDSAATGGAASSSGGAASSSGGAASSSGGAASSSGGAASASGGASSGSGGATGSTEGFTVDMVNDMIEEDEFEPGRPDQWKNEKHQLLPGMNI